MAGKVSLGVQEVLGKDAIVVVSVIVSLLAILLTILIACFLHFRKQKLLLDRARGHFVKAAISLTQSQTAKSPEESQRLAQESISEADLAIFLDPNDPAVYVIKSLALEMVGKSSAAIADLTAALSRPKVRRLSIPERASTLAKRAELNLATPGGMYKDALQDLEESVALTPRNPRTHLLLGEAYEKTGLRDKAVEAFNQASLLDPKSPSAQVALERLRGPATVG